MKTLQPFVLSGAGTTNRTRDLLITSQLLYQLSYAGFEVAHSIKPYEGVQLFFQLFVYFHNKRFIMVDERLMDTYSRQAESVR